MKQSVKNIYHLFRALTANTVYRFPSKKLKIIGVTGTDGKTTTTSLIYHILKTSGRKVSMISSVYAKIGATEHDIGFHVTSPDPFSTQKYLHMSQKAGDEFFVLETTSHALDQNRVWGIKFDIGVITNVSHEHLDYHKTYENYVKTKARLLKYSKRMLINMDDKSYQPLRSFVEKHSESSLQNLYTYGLNDSASFHENMEARVGLPLADFNKYNYLAAYGVCKLLGISDEEIISALKTFVLPPGRIDVVIKKPFTVIIDFAHTPNAIEEILKYVKSVYCDPGSRLIHVFSSAAKRDESKRPLMGEASAKYSDLVILTEEDYRTEDPRKINKEIAAGLLKGNFKEVPPADFGNEAKTYAVIIDRKEAINKAITVAKPGDVVVSTGKGHEKSLCRGKIEYPWDDKQAVLEALERFRIKE